MQFSVCRILETRAVHAEIQSRIRAFVLQIVSEDDSRNNDQWLIGTTESQISLLVSRRNLFRYVYINDECI